MFSVAPIITEAGMTLLLRAAGGEKITFTKFQIGSGIMDEGEDMKTMTALKNVVLGNIPIQQAEGTEESGYIQMTASFNNQTDITEAFRWTELGLIAEDEDGEEYLYAYGYDNTYAELISPSESSVIIEQHISVIIAIGESENITANVIPNATYASRQEFLDHKGDETNPHSVTYSQVGAAAETHTHGANDITIGILPVSRGGTGVNSLDALKAAVSLNYIVGHFAGDGTIRKDITLGYKPSLVYLIELPHGRSNSEDVYGGYFSEGNNIWSGYSPASAAYEDATTLLNRGYGGAAVTADGFAVGYSSNGRTHCNAANIEYLYLAFK